MFEQKRYEFLLQCDEPIAHHSEVFGNSAVLMRQRVRQPDGEFIEVPIVTGDTMRHGLREAAAYALLDAAGLLGKEALTEAALRLLFAGGMLTGTGDGATIKLDEYRTMIDLVPSLSLLGGCASNRTIPGKLQVGNALLVCDETMSLLPPWVRQYLDEMKVGTDTHRAHVEEVQRVRMDPSLVPAKRALLSEGDRARIEGRLLSSEKASEEGDHAAKDAAKSTMLPRRFETIVAGSLLFWRVSATCHSEIDVATFHSMVGAFLGNAKVGGKRGTGHGSIRPIAGTDVEVLRPSADTKALAFGRLPGAEIFRQHVSARAERVAEFLRGVNA